MESRNVFFLNGYLVLMSEEACFSKSQILNPCKQLRKNFYKAVVKLSFVPLDHLHTSIER